MENPAFCGVAEDVVAVPDAQPVDGKARKLCDERLFDEYRLSCASGHSVFFYVGN